MIKYDEHSNLFLSPITNRISDKDSHYILRRSTIGFHEFSETNKTRLLSFQEFYDKYAECLSAYIKEHNPYKELADIYTVFNNFFTVYGFTEVMNFPVRYNNYVLYISFKRNSCTPQLSIEKAGTNEPIKGCSPCSSSICIDTEDNCPMFEVAYDLWDKANTFVSITYLDKRYYHALNAIKHYQEFGRFDPNQIHIFLELDTKWNIAYPRVKCAHNLVDYFNAKKLKDLLNYASLKPRKILYLAKYKVVKIDDTEKEVFIWCQAEVEKYFCHKICKFTTGIATYNEDNAIHNKIRLDKIEGGHLDICDMSIDEIQDDSYIISFVINQF